MRMGTPAILIENGTLIDGTGSDPRPDTALLLSGDEITAVGQEALDTAAGVTDLQRIDASGKTVMPGLVDCHTHMTFSEPEGNDELFFHRTEGYSAMVSAYYAEKVLRAGVTALLDPDSLWNLGVELRDAIESNVVIGPRMKAGGNALMTAVGGTAGRLIKDDGRTGYGVVVHSRDDIVSEVRKQVKYGVDWIKVHVTGLIPTRPGKEISVWTLDELKAVVETAHDLGIPVVGHARNAESTRDAARAGFDLIYHASYMDGEALEAVVESGSTLCPTFTLLGNLADWGVKIGTAPELLDVFRAEIEVTAQMVRKAHEAGVRVVAGSETGFAITPYGVWHARELEMLVEYMGFTPMEAILAFTRDAAAALGWDDLGTLESGRRADVLVIDGNPLADVTILQDPARISDVISRGQIVDRSRPMRERQIMPGEKVRLLAGRNLTRELALADDEGEAGE
jgi:imidazolonepropionase-like amidohydrolase